MTLTTGNLPNSGPAIPGVVQRGGIVMVVLFLIFFLGVSDNQMVSPLLPLIAREFKLGSGEAGKLIGPAYALAAAFVALIVGPASDRLGRRRFLLYAALLFGLSLLSVLIIGDIRTLAGVRFFTGLAAGTFSTCSIAYVGDYFPYERRGVAMSVVNSGYFAALVAGVPVSSILAQRYGWRSGFGAFGVIAIVVFVLILLLLPADEPGQGSGNTPHHESRRLERMMGVFATTERRAAIAAAFFVSAGFVGFIFYLGSWLGKTYHLETDKIGYVFIGVGFVSLLGSLVAGPIADRYGKRGLSIISTVVLSAMLLLIPLTGWGPLLLGTFLVASLAFAFRQGPLQALATELVPREARGALVAVRTTTSQVGIAISTAACGLLYDRYGYAAVGALSAALTLGAGVCIYLMREPRQDVQIEGLESNPADGHRTSA
jgi:predicted MFS family arabinose efflux permease